jgi:hypothetical protein
MKPLSLASRTPALIPCGFLAVALRARAQQITGTPGLSGAAATIPGAQQPPSPPPFRGRIELGAGIKVERPLLDVTDAVNQNPAGFPDELSCLCKDWAQPDDVAAMNPARLRELEELFWDEARGHQLPPLDATAAASCASHRPSSWRRRQ